MILVHHTDECAGKPSPKGLLTAPCNCKTAPMTADARKRLTSFLGTLAGESIKAKEPALYFAVRLEILALQIAKDARAVRRTAAFSDRAAGIPRKRRPKVRG